MNADGNRRLRFGLSIPKNDPLPFDFRFLEVHQQANLPAGGPQVIEALCGMLVAKAFDAFQLDHQNIFHQDVSKVFPNWIGPCN